MDTYSFHRLLGEVRPMEPSPRGDTWTLEQLLEQLEALDIDMVSVQTALLPEPSGTALEKVSRWADHHGLGLVVAWGHPRGVRLKTHGPAWDDLDRICRLARDLGQKHVRMVLGNHADRAALSDAELNRLVSRLSVLVERWRNEGISLAVENHVALPASRFVEVVQQVDHLGVVLDLGNIARVGGDPVDMATRLAGRVVMVHAKDYRLPRGPHSSPAGPWWTTPLGRGDLEVSRTLAVLRRQGYNGPVCVELQELHPAWEEQELLVVAESIRWLRRVWCSAPPANGGPAERANSTICAEGLDRG